MTERLREELHRLGDAAPDLLVPDDTWARGRRARGRDRVVTGLLVAGLVLLAGTLLRVTPASQLAAEVLAPAPTAVDTGLPDHLYAVPDRLVLHRQNPANESTWDSRVAETDLATGPAIAAFTAGESDLLPVVVGNADGAYHPLVLPGYSDATLLNSMASGSAALALSPDGRSLAYAWWDPTAPLDAPMPAGIRIVDLTTGGLRTLELHGGNGVDVDQIAWSPDGGWLAWSGMQTRSWTPGSRGGATLVAGRVRVSDLASEPVPGLDNQEWGVSVSDAGVLTLWSGQSLRTWDGVRLRRVAVPGPRGIGDGAPRLATSSGDLIALSPTVRDQSFIRVVEQRQGALTFRGDVRPAEATDRVETVGWLGDRLLTVSRAADGSSATLGLAEVAAAGASEPEPLATVDPGVHNLTVAVDLLDPAQPTVARPAPSWPWPTERKVAVGALVVVVLAVSLLLLARRRSPTGGHRRAW